LPNSAPSTNWPAASPKSSSGSINSTCAARRQQRANNLPRVRLFRFLACAPAASALDEYRLLNLASARAALVRCSSFHGRRRF
jgi:hypothetical protein